MLRRTPPLEAIEIFCAAARGDSFRSVAHRLALSPSAVGRRIATLESFLGVALFDRTTQSPTFNAAGRRYLSLVEPAIGAIRRATSMASEADSQRIRIATSHSFAGTWLMPRLADLHRREGIEVEIVPSRDFDVLRSGEAQLGIWGGLGVPDDMIAETMVEARVVPVVAPGVTDGLPPPACAADLLERTLLTVRSPAKLWDRWFAASGIEAQPQVVREFATLQLMYEAAAAGLGITLAMPLVAEPYLASGRLVSCLPDARTLGETYRLYRVDRRVVRTPAEQRFAHWLHQAVAISVARFEEMLPVTAAG